MKNDDFHVSFKLRQHTPIIHFQANQTGSILRASELKPAFDHYLWKEAFNNSFDKGKLFIVGYSEAREAELKKQFIQEGELALDYRVSIVAENDSFWQEDLTRPIVQIRNGQAELRVDINNQMQYESFPGFFGDIGSNEIDKQLKLYQPSASIYIKFTTIHTVLSINIKHFFKTFLYKKNFGARQSKGFGSFTIDDSINVNESFDELNYSFTIDLSSHINRNEMDWINAEHLRNNIPKPNEAIIEMECQRLLFKHIELFWRTVRSGINMPGRNRTTILYIKPPLFYYLAQQGKQWDKKSIKQYYFSYETKNKDQKIPTNHPILYRDLLGLASSVTWGKDNRGKGITIAKNHLPHDRNNQINRFKSPVTFKPVRSGNRFTVYFSFDSNEPIPKEMYGQSFAITKNGTGDLVMDTPHQQQFNLVEFMDFVVGDYADRVKSYRYEMGDNSFINANFQSNELKMLKVIFESITKIQ